MRLSLITLLPIAISLASFASAHHDQTNEAREDVGTLSSRGLGDEFALERREVLEDIATRDLLDELEDRLARRGGPGPRRFYCEHASYQKKKETKTKSTAAYPLESAELVLHEIAFIKIEGTSVNVVIAEVHDILRNCLRSGEGENNGEDGENIVSPAKFALHTVPVRDPPDDGPPLIPGLLGAIGGEAFLTLVALLFVADWPQRRLGRQTVWPPESDQHPATTPSLYLFLDRANQMAFVARTPPVTRARARAVPASAALRDEDSFATPVGNDAATTIATAGQGPTSGLAPTRLFSEVAASRPSSPAGVRSATPEGNRQGAYPQPRSSVAVPTPAVEAHVEDTQSRRMPSGGNTFGLPPVPRTPAARPPAPENDDGQWVTVTRRRRARSLESPKPQFPFDEPGQPLFGSRLTSAQLETVRRAEHQIPENDRQRVARRNDAIAADTAHISKNADGYSSDESSRGEGPSQPKGKGADPRNWGGINLDEDELDVDAQRVALEQFNQQRDAEAPKSPGPPALVELSSDEDVPIPKSRQVRAPRERKTRDYRERRRSPERSEFSVEDLMPSQLNRRTAEPRHTSRAPTADNVPRRERGASARAAANTAPHTFIANALNLLGDRSSNGSRRSPSRRRDDRDDDDHRRPRHRGGNPDGNDPDPSDSDAGPGGRRDRSRGHYPRDRYRSRSRSPARRMNIKAPEPTTYSGRQSVQDFTRFIRQYHAYTEIGHVPDRLRVFLVSNFLSGRASEFYEQRVSSDPESWTLQRLFEEMFNYIFPPDYRLEMRDKIEAMYQGSRSVNDYVHALEEAFNLIGDYTDKEKVVKLFRSFKPSIEAALWLDRLDPECSTWDEVVQAARIIEIAEASANRARNRSRHEPRRFGNSDRSTHQSGGNTQHGNNANNHGSSRQSNDVGGRDRRRGQSRANSRGQSSAPSNPPNNQRHRSQQSSSRHGNRPQNNNRGSSSRPQPSQASKPRLSPDEEAELRAAGKCFSCKEVGHYTRNCPRMNSVRAPNGKPPGLVNHNIDIPEGSDDENAVLEDMPYGVHAIGMSYDSEDDDDVRYDEAERLSRFERFKAMCRDEREISPDVRHDDEPYDVAPWARYHPRNRPRPHLGDQYAMVAANILNSSGPYPGDRRSVRKSRNRCPNRFWVRRAYVDDYAIDDRLTRTTLLISAHRLRDPNFAIAQWYADHRARTLNIPSEREYTRTMGDPVATVAECHLRDGAAQLYPPPSDSSIDPEDRFVVQKYGFNFYCISDAARDRRVLIHSSDISDPLFNLAGWYRLVVRRERGYGACEIPDDDDMPGLVSGAQSPELAPAGDPVDLDLTLDLYDAESTATDGDDGRACRSRELERDPSHIGDVYGTTLQLLLCRGAPYPGEPSLRSMTLSERKRLQDRFIVYRLNEDSPIYEIYDRTHDREACLSEETIGDPRFNPALWYARRCCREQNLDESSEIAHWAIGRFVGETAIGRSLERRIQDSLARGAPYLADISVPIDPKVARFGVELDSTTTHLRHYLVIDRHLELTSYLPASRVRDPRFNAASWYEFELEARLLRFPLASRASELMWTVDYRNDREWCFT
ncbi:hypothetical protein D9611_009565 [Ephemerocybe angulata]|uniref:CCHC-type domain-containing protein n=1 Tax=Ephemerocybe angulata TaxID=980116 RepID=A0A8H5C5N2_9AGAR|nr:hypothetical protein D9611_009565 [Tulosesus angulatus]